MPYTRTKQTLKWFQHELTCTTETANVYVHNQAGGTTHQLIYF